jgi:phosphoribosyl-AMP cyclohydrolase
LLSAVVQDAASGEVLMVAFMDSEALEATRTSGLAHFHSRSRGRLWKKGESSGHVLEVESILVDCDQDALVLKVRPAGPACHTGARSCFYRTLESVNSGEGLAYLKG